MNKLLFQSTLSSSAIIEYVALCVTGWITTNRIRTSGFEYLIDTTGDSHQFAIEKISKKPLSDLVDELILFLLGLSALDSKIECIGEWKSLDKIEHAIDWIKSKESFCKPLSNSNQIHHLTNLTLQDLQEIHELFENEEKSTTECLYSAKFSELFPFSDLYDSNHGSLRHAGGNECYIDFADEKSPIRHKIDAPCPADFRYEEWRSSFEGRKPPRFRKNTSPSKGYYRSANDRWKIAKMLGEIPVEHKPKVYSWVNSTIKTVDAYHDTRGSDGPLPEKFDLDFGDQKITATRDLVFSFGKK